MSYVVTISRQYGSGGRELGEKLAKKLGIPFYDKELINLIAEKENIEVSLLEAYDEAEPDLEGYTARNIAPTYQTDMAMKVFDAYSRTIRNLAKQGPCVIVGRCADAILLDSVRVFVYSDLDSRIHRIREKEGLSPEAARKHIEQMDRRRRGYRRFYCRMEWARMENYDICLNTGRVGVDGALETLLTYLEQRK